MPIQDIICVPSVGTSFYLRLFIFELFMKALSLTRIFQPLQARHLGSGVPTSIAGGHDSQQLDSWVGQKKGSLFISFGCKKTRKQKPAKETSGVKLGLFSAWFTYR